MTDKLTKPEPRTATIIVEYWACNVEAHRHQSSQTAANCIALKRGQGRLVPLPDLVPRDVAAAKRVLSGETCGAVARDLGISAGRVNSVVRTVIRRTKYKYRDEIRPDGKRVEFQDYIFGYGIEEMRKNRAAIIPWLNRYLEEHCND